MRHFQSSIIRASEEKGLTIAAVCLKLYRFFQRYTASPETQRDRLKTFFVVEVKTTTPPSLIKIKVVATFRTSKKCVLDKQIFSEKGTPQLVIWNSPCVWVPVQFSGINQSSQRNSLDPLISWFYYFPDSRPVSPYPHFSFVLISSKAKEGLFFPLSISPSTTAELFSCRKGSFIRLHTQESPTASRGLSLLSFFAHSFFLSDKPHSVLFFKKKEEKKRCTDLLFWHTKVFLFAYPEN